MQKLSKKETIIIISWKDLCLYVLYSLPKDFPEAAKAATVGYFTGVWDGHIDALVVIVVLEQF